MVGRPRAVDATVHVAAVALVAHGRAVPVVERRVVIHLVFQAQRRVVRPEHHVIMADAHRPRAAVVLGPAPSPRHRVAGDVPAVARGVRDRPAGQTAAVVGEARDADAAHVRHEAGHRVVGDVHAVRERLAGERATAVDHPEPRTVRGVVHQRLLPRRLGGRFFFIFFFFFFRARRVRVRRRRLQARLSFRRPPARPSVVLVAVVRVVRHRGGARLAVGPRPAVYLRRVRRLRGRFRRGLVGQRRARQCL